jgi:triphosphoribosyl-dephospho-CoA synthase
VLASGVPEGEDYLRALSDFDFWLRCDGHRRNPGTTADLIAAGLFAALRDGLLVPPFR